MIDHLERAQALAEKHDVLLDLFKLYRNDDPQRALRYRSEGERIEQSSDFSYSADASAATPTAFTEAV
jgi:hypothetical protein